MVAVHEVDAKVAFVTDAETTQAWAKLGFNPEEARDVNVLRPEDCPLPPGLVYSPARVPRRALG